MAEHNERGREAEDIAISYLTEKGYRIRSRNWRYYHKELDIVAEKGDELIIVEVKSRTGKVSADELFTRSKQKYVTDAAEAYIQRYDIDKETRFDMVIVSFTGEGIEIEHIEGAFIPGVNW